MVRCWHGEAGVGSMEWVYRQRLGKGMGLGEIKQRFSLLQCNPPHENVKPHAQATRVTDCSDHTLWLYKALLMTYLKLGRSSSHNSSSTLQQQPGTFGNSPQHLSCQIFIRMHMLWNSDMSWMMYVSPCMVRYASPYMIKYASTCAVRYANPCI